MDITARLNIDVPGIKSDKKPGVMVSEHPKRAREAALGFHTTEGAGGVIGVIAGDCLNGTHNEPERYLGCFEIFDEGIKPSLSGASSADFVFDLKSQCKQKEWKIEKEEDDNNRGWNEVMSSKLNSPAPVKKKEVLRKATLTFKERVMYRTNHLLNIPFEEAPREELMAKINDQYINLQVMKSFKK